MPPKLKNRNLVINAEKTEEYKISGKNCDDLWKKCKFLGTMLDTQCDIKRRKGLAIDALKKLKYIFNNKKISIITKTRTLNAYILPIFLYNCETWTLTASNEKSIEGKKSSQSKETTSKEKTSSNMVCHIVSNTILVLY